MDRVRVAAVGAGGIFRGAHLPSYPQIHEAKLVALCDISEASLTESLHAARRIYERQAEQLKESGRGDIAEQLLKDVEELKLYRDYDRMLQEIKPDIVDICTMPDTHAKVAIASLKSGAHVMCEKPMARTWLECAEVIEAVEESGRFYQHNENWIYDPLYHTLRRLVQMGAFGELQLVFISCAHQGPENRTAFWDPMINGGGAMVDMAVHAFTTAWFLAGFNMKPVWVKAAEPNGICIKIRERIIANTPRNIEVEDDAHILVHFEEPNSGKWSNAHVEGSWSGKDAIDGLFIGTQAVARCKFVDGRPQIELTDTFGKQHLVEAIGPNWTHWPSSFYGEIRTMIECVLQNRKPPCDHIIGADTQAAMGAAYLSQLEGMRKVTLEEYKEWALSIKRKAKRNASEALIREQLKALKVGLGQGT
ncbi:MAG: Gfo/Idh/MocA family oxidoreductase [Armatimonadota bacterium]|nr:Gfo/Idh/MocA family oxidoreductase [Armatimonadota bacterium]MCX7776477.1 Gfo/Idh/MocA family oxidoreductase [Armatimonadota bacterium]MDW8024274.1 Gfo/Idh/MocA family oxidoreductase [Armatimonadota bacterium]